MAFYRKSGGGNVAPAVVKRRSGGTWADVQEIKRRSGGAWVSVWTAVQPLSAVTNVSTVSGQSAAKATVTTGSVTVSVTGGVGPFTYAWEKVSGDAMTVTQPTAYVTAFSAFVSDVNPYFAATFRCKVTDSKGTVTYTNNVAASVRYTGVPV